MLCRTLLTIIAVSYLICVLILNGLQKEDLDVNMLKKLERHGLNIEDVNNESLRENCLKIGKTTVQDELVRTEDPIITTSTTEMTLIDMNQQNEKLNDKDTNKTELKDVIKYFIDLQNSKDKTKTKHANETITKKNIFDNYHIPQNSNLEYKFSDVIGYNSPQLNINNLQTSTTDATFHFFSQNILKLWNTYSNDNVRAFTSEPTTLQTTSNPVEIISKNDPETDIVKKIIADYLSKNQIISVTTQLPVKKELDIDRISNEIRRFLASTQNVTQKQLQNNVKITESINTKPQTNAYANNTAHDFYRNIGKETGQLFDRRPTLEEKNIVAELLKNKTNLPLKEMVKFDAQKGKNNFYAQRNYMQNNKARQNENKNSNTYLENYKLLDDSILNTVNNIYSNMEKSNHPRNKEVSVPNDIIKEIAESVKAIILKDLKKEMLTLTTTTMTTETSSIGHSRHGEKKGIETTNHNIMEKFMELFQQFKSTNEKTIISGNSQMKVTEHKNVKHEYKGPVKVIYSSNKPAMNPYGVPSPTEQFAPIFVKQYIHESDMNTPKYIVLPNIQNPVYQVRQIDNFNVKTGIRLAPITIQTNSFEVPPLGIPIEKPLGMVNQNIIVTTKSPNLRPRLDTHHRNYMPHINYRIDYDFRTRNGLQKPLSNPKIDIHSRTSDDAYTLHEHFKVKKSDRLRFDNHNDRDYDRNYKPHFTKSDYDRMKLRNQEIKRFHEKLENTDEYKNTEEKEDCCKILVASRQQLPLTNAKKRLKYDDVHFRNFLKTQQKVNDMLEKILATKTKSDGPHSVETT